MTATLHTTSCRACGKSFEKETSLKADQALRLHLIRAHPKKHYKSRFDTDEVPLFSRVNGVNGHRGTHVRLNIPRATGDLIRAFIVENHAQYATQMECLQAAYVAVGVRHQATHGAASRYFTQARSKPKARDRKPGPAQAVVLHKAVPAPAPASVLEAACVTVAHCPNCGFDVRATAFGHRLVELLLQGHDVSVDGKKVVYVQS